MTRPHKTNRVNAKQEFLDLFSDKAKRDAEIYRMRQMGCTIYEIAKEIGYSFATIQMICREQELHRRALETNRKEHDRKVHRLPCGLDNRELTGCARQECYLRHKCPVYNGPNRQQEQFARDQARRQEWRQYGFI